MSYRSELQRCGREWLGALMAYALLVAPFGCQFRADLLSDLVPGAGQPTARTAGLFINPDTSDPLMVAGRNAVGDAFFVYGTRSSGDGIGEVQSILVQTADGRTSFILLELGRPVFAQGPDGSFVRIRYTDVTPRRLAGTATVRAAATAADQSVEFTIDLEKTARQVADRVRATTGLALIVPEAPEAAQTKRLDRAASKLLLAIAVVPLVLVSQYMIVVMGQIVAEMFAAVTVAVQAAVLAAFMPLFLFSSLLGQATVRIESVPLFDVFITLPPAPTINVEIG